MPNGTNARYNEWELWFSRIAQILNEEVILIGHSLGGIFLVKCLSENIFPKKTKAVILVAAPFDNSDKIEGGESLVDFALLSSLEKLVQQVDKIYLIHSKDDPVVHFTQLTKYQRALPNAEAIIFENRGHFNQETFPEIIEIIKSM